MTAVQCKIANLDTSVLEQVLLTKAVLVAVYLARQKVAHILDLVIAEQVKMIVTRHVIQPYVKRVHHQKIVHRHQNLLRVARLR